MMFDLGLGFWILFFVIFLGCGRMCGWGVRRYRRRRDEGEPALSDEEDRRLADLESRIARLTERSRRYPPSSRREDGAEPAKAARRTTPLQELQRKFVEGRLSLEEYERALDRLDRLD
jgi:hypothetical protein